MIGLETFRDASTAPAVRGGARMSLRDDGAGVVPHTGRVARWFGALRRADNREVTGRFVEACASAMAAR